MPKWHYSQAIVVEIHALLPDADLRDIVLRLLEDVDLAMPDSMDAWSAAYEAACDEQDRRFVARGEDSVTRRLRAIGLRHRSRR